MTTLSARCLKNQRTVGTSLPPATNAANKSTKKANRPHRPPLLATITFSPSSRKSATTVARANITPTPATRKPSSDTELGEYRLHNGTHHPRFRHRLLGGP